jgi:hypothetical protein
MGGIGRVVATGVVLAGTFFAASEPAVSLAAVIPDSLIIRVYDNAGILAGDRARAISRAREILTRAQLDIEFRDCPARGDKAPAVCTVPPRPGELIVRLVRGAGATNSDDAPDTGRALGSSLIDTATGTGTLATVFVDRIEGMANQARADRWGIVGRVMAHEIGHLLLGSNAHSRTGLMREIWTLAELTRNRAQDWMFSSAQREMLREARLLGRRMTTAAARGADTSRSGG